MTIAVCLAVCLVAAVSAPVSAAILWDNGPIVTHPGQGPGGGDASVVQTSNGLQTLGFPMSGGLNQVVADDFVLGDGSGIWLIDGFKFWGYQPGATEPSIDLLAVAILDRAPYLPGMQVLWATTGVPTVTMTDTYRVLDTDMSSTTNRIQLIEFTTAPITLPGGTYWLAWSTGSTGTGGTWVPAVTMLDVDYPGNGLQIINTTNVTPLLDAGTNTQKGVPFQVTGSAVPEPALMAQMLFGGGLGMLAFLRRGRKRN